MRLPFLKQGRKDEPLIVSMSGARLGDRVLVAGASSAISLPLAARVGLSGQATAVPPSEAVEPLRRLAERQGAVLDVVPPPLGPSDVPYDLAILDETTGAAPLTPAEVRPVLRPGGRLIIVRPGSRAGLFARLGGGGETAGSEDAAVIRTLEQAGFSRARMIGDREGWRFFEGFRGA